MSKQLLISLKKAVDRSKSPCSRLSNPHQHLGSRSVTAVVDIAEIEGDILERRTVRDGGNIAGSSVLEHNAVNIALVHNRDAQARDYLGILDGLCNGGYKPRRR